jgi:SAM-dependent methyltransferase
MDSKTLKFYAENATQLTAKYNAVTDGISKYFATAFIAGEKVLDIGCGSGRDLRILHEMGYQADGIDACEEFVETIKQDISGYDCVVAKDALPELTTVDDKKYGGVLCSAVLMHLPEEQLFDAAFSIRKILKEQGRLLLSIPLYDETINAQIKRDMDGRFFNSVTPEELQLLFERIGFKLLNRWNDNDSLNREHRKWATMLFELESATGSRPIDTIESILNKDAKVATYKLALFRSFANIATTNYKLAQWTDDGRVKIHTQVLAEKWIEYYWPIIEAGIKQTTGKAIAFRIQLQNLVQYYHNRGGLSAFSLEYRNNKLSVEATKLCKQLLAVLKRTIWNQPVRFAGGGEPFSVFQYDKTDQTIIIGNDIWKELSLMGTWIQDATILRWAELTARISKNELKPSAVIDCLLTVPIKERDVNAVKLFYDALPNKRCVWTDKDISNKYNLDHAIPFSLWKNNDLWNLLPADAKVNGNKSDKLPENRVIKARKESIINYWILIQNEFPARFEYEASKLVGQQQFDQNNWENKLFATFAEAVEITAIQRGIERWAPASFAATGTDVVFSSKLTNEKQHIIDFSSEHVANVTLGNKRLNIIEFPTAKERFILCVPFYDLAATAGSFDLDQTFAGDTLSEHKDWIKIEDRKLAVDMFVIQVIGHSMEPKINDGDYCLFRAGTALGGTRQGRTMLVKHHSINDADMTGQMTVKSYHSEKNFDEYGNIKHSKITLKPLNPVYKAIIIDSIEEVNEFQVLGELVSVI